MLKHSDFLSQRPTTPMDDALPGGNRIVDRTFLSRILRDRIACDVADDELRFTAIRYKPSTRLTVTVSTPATNGRGRAFTLRAFRAGEARDAYDKLLRRGIPIGATEFDPDNELILLEYPRDYELRGLRKFVPGRDGAVYLRRLVPQLATESMRLRSYSFRPTLLRYKPERHAVLKLDFRVQLGVGGTKESRSLIARVFPADELPEGAVMPGNGDVTPKFVAADRERGIVIESFAPGESLRDRLLVRRASGFATEQDLEAVGRSLARFHAADIDASPDGIEAAKRQRCARLTSAVETMSNVDGEIADEMAPLVERLSAAISIDRGRFTMAHRDLHPGQIICDDDRVTFVDTEKCAIDAAASDVGALAFYLDRNSDAIGREAERQALLAGYEAVAGWRPNEDQLALWQAVAALERATAPLRNLHPRWRSWSRAYVDRSRRYAVNLSPDASRVSSCAPAPLRSRP